MNSLGSTAATFFLFTTLLCGCESEQERSNRLAAREKAAEIAQEVAAKRQADIDKTLAAEDERQRLYLEFLDSIESSDFFEKYGITRDEKVRAKTFYFYSDISGAIIEIKFGSDQIIYAHAYDTNFEVSRKNRQFLLEFCRFFIGDDPITGLDSYLSINLPMSISSMKSAAEFKYNGFTVKAGKVLSGGGVLIEK